MENTKNIQGEAKCISGRIHLKTLTKSVIKFTATDNRSTSSIEVNLNIPSAINLSENVVNSDLHYGDLLSFFESYPVEIHLYRFGKDTIPEDVMTTSFNEEWDNVGGTICEISEERYNDNLRITVEDMLLHVAGQHKKLKLYNDETSEEDKQTDILSIPASTLHSYFPEIHLGDILIIRIKRLTKNV